MRKMICSSAVLLVFFIISSCTIDRDELPQGVWESEYPNITLYINPTYQNPSRPGLYLGFYTKDDKSSKIFMAEHVRIQQLFIHEFSTLRENRGIVGPAFIDGIWNVVDNRMYLAISPGLQEEIGVEQIIFHRLDEYTPINPDDWFP